MNKIIATDLDGTLFYPKRKIRMINPKYVTLLRKYIDNGDKVAIVSGRNFDYAEKVVKKIGRHVDMICCNSAYVRVNDKVIQDKGIKPNIVNIFEQLSKKFKVYASALMSKNYSLLINMGCLKGIVKWLIKFYYYMQGVYAEKYVIDESNTILKSELSSGKVYKLMIFFGLGRKGRENARFAQQYLHDNYPEIESAYTGSFIEITPKDCHKADGLKKVCEYYKASVNDVYVVGDSGNDIPMFDAFYENSFCMSHAPEHVRCHAKYVIKNFNKLERYLG